MAKTIDDIQKVLIVGAGTLGLRIALRCAMDGYDVTLYDIQQEQLDIALSTQGKLIRDLHRKGMIDDDMVTRAKSSLRITTDINQAVTDVDLVSESVIENLEIKKQFYTDFAPRLPKGTIVTTNTSYLLPSQLLDSIVEPQNFCALHFHDVFNQIVVDVMPHSQTASSVVDLLMVFGKRINQIPVLINKESSGYIFNSILMAIIGQSADLWINGVGSLQDIDRSFMGNFQTMAGPFGMLDQVGLDTLLHILEARQDEGSIAFAKVVKKYVEQGKLGYKTGEGFYTYPNPEFAQKEFLL